MPKPGSPEGASILHLAPFDFGSNGSLEVPLRFVELSGRPHVLYSAANPPEWISWATRALVRWRIGDETFVGNGSPVDDPATLENEILPRYARQSGAERLSRWFGPLVGCIALSESINEGSYHDRVEALFDQAAREYDRTVQGDRLNQHPRRVSHELLNDLFPSGSHVLELGCGTGLETIPLAEAGVNVVAVDISAKMLAELDRKARATSLGNLIVTRKGAISQLSAILSDFGPGSFDGAFSHFGAINCEPNLAGLPATLHRLIKADGRISLGILNRTSLAEILLFTARLRPKRAFARFRSGPVGLRRRTFRDGVRLYAAYGVSMLLRILAPSRFGSVGFWVRGNTNLGVSVDGVRFDVRPRTNDLDLISSKHEPMATRSFQVAAGDVVVDVGAHIGRYALRAATKASKVIAVEPDPSNFTLLERNVRMNGFSNVVLVPHALSSVPGTRALWLAGSGNTGTSSVDPDASRARGGARSPGTVPVEALTLDELVESVGLTRIDWLKVDVEGHEIAVLQGRSEERRVGKG